MRQALNRLVALIESKKHIFECYETKIIYSINPIKKKKKFSFEFSFFPRVSTSPFQFEKFNFSFVLKPYFL